LNRAAASEQDAGMGILVEPMTMTDLADVLADHARFWGERDMRFLHLTALVQEFGETCLTARRGGRIDGYLIGFTTPRRLGYIHAAAVRDTVRLSGVAGTLYRAFARAAVTQGAGSAKAITSVTNDGSVAFHRRLGFEASRVEDYNGPGQPMMVMTRPLPWA
jgi:ribosomal protein S18 acetylase RimI-like enzyme